MKILKEKIIKIISQTNYDPSSGSKGQEKDLEDTANEILLAFRKTLPNKKKHQDSCNDLNCVFRHTTVGYNCAVREIEELIK